MILCVRDDSAQLYRNSNPWQGTILSTTPAKWNVATPLSNHCCVSCTAKNDLFSKVGSLHFILWIFMAVKALPSFFKMAGGTRGDYKLWTFSVKISWKFWWLWFHNLMQKLRTCATIISTNAVLRITIYTDGDPLFKRLILLIEEISNTSLSHYLQGFCSHPKWIVLGSRELRWQIAREWCSTA